VENSTLSQTSRAEDSNIILCCKRTDGNQRRYKKSDGLFKKGIKRNKKSLSHDEQVRRIRLLPYIKSYDEKNDIAIADLDWAGVYEIKLCFHRPIVKRLDTHNDSANPFIRRKGFITSSRLCLGNVSSLYRQSYGNNNMIEALKVAVAVLQSKDNGHERVYRKWDDVQKRTNTPCHGGKIKI